LICCGVVGLGCDSDDATSGARRYEAVSFPAEGITLEWTLVIPVHEKGARLPAVILTHGSGDLDRDETVGGQLGMDFEFTIPVFGEIADRLVDAGYIVLKYDKRTCTADAGCRNHYPNDPQVLAAVVVDDLVADALSGLDYLATRADVDPHRRFFLGHSQGAGFAPEVLALRRDVRAGVMLAAPYRAIDDVFLAQRDRLAQLIDTLGGHSATDEQLAAFTADVAAVHDVHAGTYGGADLIMGDTVAYWRSWLDLADRMPARLAGLDRPLLALSGDYDWNVDPSETARWMTAFAAVDHDPGHEAMILPCLSHVLNCIAQPDVTKLRPSDFGRHVDPAAVDAIVQFLDRQK